MKTGSSRQTMQDEGNFASGFGRYCLVFVWQAVRLPILAFLVILEPFARLLLWGAAVLGVLTAFVFEYSGAVPDFPFWQTIAISVGCMLLLGGYYGLMRLLS